MRKRNYLLALALPALMTACVQDEFTQENAGSDLRLVENPIEGFSLDVNVGDDVQTRLTGNNKWEEGDEMGLVWFNPWYYDWQDEMQQLNKPQFYANNRMTINGGANGSVWKSDATIMEGSHFAYFPYQTVWGEGYLQVKGGQEILKVYNATDQKDDAENRYDWMMNHQTLLSPAYEFTQEDGTAGFSDSRRINLYLFSNRLNIKPVFENAPADLTVYGYELVASNGYNGTYDAFVTEAEILANMLPTSDKFRGGCNWATLDQADTKLADFYNPTKFADALSINYEQVDGVSAVSAPGFTFLLLPADTDDLKWADGYATNSVIRLIARTNYGTITITDVTGKFSANSTTDVAISLSKLYYNGDNASRKSAADTYVGFLGNAGTTRGGKPGENINGTITATFDFANVELDLGCVSDNQSLLRALEMIENFKTVLGEAYTEETITICQNATFEDLDFTKTIEDAEAKTGVDIKVAGQTWNDGGTQYSKITWKGESSIAQEIANTNNYVEGILTADVNTTNGLTTTFVLEGGTLNNLGTARRVTVEENGVMNNSGLAKIVNNYGTVWNQPALTTEPADQPRISELYNYATVYNYAAIESVEANENEEGTAVIELRNNENKAENGEFLIGSIFSINEVYKPETNIRYTVANTTSAVTAAKDLAVALNNYATNIFVNDKVDIDATASTTMNGQEYGARVTFLGKTTYTIQSSAQFDNAVRLGEIVLAEGAKVTVKNQLFEGGNLTEDIYALAASRMAMNDRSSLTVGGGTAMACRVIYVEPNATATIKTDTKVNHSGVYYITLSTEDAKAFNQSGNVNFMPDEIKEKFGWE